MRTFPATRSERRAVVLAEPCDACATGIAACWGWDGRRLCWNCVDDLEARWLAQHPGYEDRVIEPANAPARTEEPAPPAPTPIEPNPEPPEAPSLF